MTQYTGWSHSLSQSIVYIIFLLYLASVESKDDEIVHDFWITILLESRKEFWKVHSSMIIVDSQS